MREKRIFVIVADTVQNPLEMDYHDAGGGHFVMKPTPETRTIVQPKGRIAAQVGHVVSKMRMHRLEAMNNEWRKAVLARHATKAARLADALMVEPYTAYTTIVLAVPDSYQLEFRHFLIRKKVPRVYFFFDQNEEYGPGYVKTAICTEPVKPEKLLGMTDYLELWR